jgi:hypothetical protein
MMRQPQHLKPTTALIHPQASQEEGQRRIVRHQWLLAKIESLRREKYLNKQARGQAELLPNQQGSGNEG